jgi:hypothetical protein
VVAKERRSIEGLADFLGRSFFAVETENFGILKFGLGGKFDEAMAAGGSIFAVGDVEDGVVGGEALGHKGIVVGRIWQCLLSFSMDF